MAGMMKGAKGMAAARMKGGKHEAPKGKEASHLPHKNPRSAHIREANGGYIMSAHGGDGEPMGADHVAPDIATIMSKLSSHMGGAEESGEMPMESPSMEMAETEKEPKKKSPPPKSKKKSKIKLRDKSETY